MLLKLPKNPKTGADRKPPSSYMPRKKPLCVLVRKNSFSRVLNTTVAEPLMIKFSMKQMKQTIRNVNFQLCFLSNKQEHNDETADLDAGTITTMFGWEIDDATGGDDPLSFSFLNEQNRVNLF